MPTSSTSSCLGSPRPRPNLDASWWARPASRHWLGDLVPRVPRGQQGLQIVLFQQLDEVNVKGWSLLSVDASDQHSRQIPIQLVVQQSHFCAILLKVAVNSLFFGSSTAVSTFLPFPASSTFERCWPCTIVLPVHLSLSRCHPCLCCF